MENYQYKFIMIRDSRSYRKTAALLDRILRVGGQRFEYPTSQLGTPRKRG